MESSGIPAKFKDYVTGLDEWKRNLSRGKAAIGLEKFLWDMRSFKEAVELDERRITAFYKMAKAEEEMAKSLKMLAEAINKRPFDEEWTEKMRKDFIDQQNLKKE
jgi:hypothetical protein